MLIVETPDLRRALTACLAATAREPDGDRHRLRLEVTPHVVHVMATDLYTMALAIVSTVDVDDDMLGAVFDLGVAEARKILAVHKPRQARAAEDMEEQQILALDVVTGDGGEHSLRSRDVSGLFPGDESLVVPLEASTTRFPDIPGYLGQRMHQQMAGRPKATTRDALVVFPERMDVLVKAAMTYKRPIAFRVLTWQHASALLATVGESFVAMVRTEQPDLDAEQPRHTDVIEAWDGWLRRLPLDVRPAEEWDVNLDDHPTQTAQREQDDKQPDEPAPDDPDEGTEDDPAQDETGDELGDELGARRRSKKPDTHQED